MYFSLFWFRTLLTWIFWSGSAKVPQQQGHLRLVENSIWEHHNISFSVRFLICTSYIMLTSIKVFPLPIAPQLDSTLETQPIIPKEMSVSWFNLPLVGPLDVQTIPNHPVKTERINLVSISRGNDLSNTNTQTVPCQPRNIKHTTNLHNTYCTGTWLERWHVRQYSHSQWWCLGEGPLRNRTKRSTSAKFKTQKMESTWSQLHKTSKIIEKLLLSTKLWWFEKS